MGIHAVIVLRFIYNRNLMPLCAFMRVVLIVVDLKFTIIKKKARAYYAIA